MTITRDELKVGIKVRSNGSMVARTLKVLFVGKERVVYENPEGHEYTKTLDMVLASWSILKPEHTYQIVGDTVIKYDRQGMTQAIQFEDLRNNNIDVSVRDLRKVTELLQTLLPIYGV